MQVISYIGMGFNGQDLAVDPKGANAIVDAKVQCSVKRIGVVHANGGQVRRPSRPGQRQQVLGRGTSEFDGRLSKNAAQAKTDHGVTPKRMGGWH
jgi:hypothetical protein